MMGMSGQIVVCHLQLITTRNLAFQMVGENTSEVSHGSWQAWNKEAEGLTPSWVIERMLRSISTSRLAACAISPAAFSRSLVSFCIIATRP